MNGTWTLQQHIHDVRQEVINDLVARKILIGERFISLNVEIDTAKTDARFVLSVKKISPVDNKLHTLLELTGRTTEELLCTQNRASLYILMSCST